MKVSPEILNELLTISPLLAKLDRVNVFGVPEGYFDDLNLRISSYVSGNWNEDLKMPNKRNLQEVPPGYFENLSDSILAKVKAAYPESAKDEIRILSSMLYYLKDENVFTVPNGYFDSLSKSILSRLAASDSENVEEEIRNLSPVLFNLRNKNVFSVPSGYFESLSENLKMGMEIPESKVISIKKRWTVWKYAAAAIATGIIAVFSFQLFNNSNTKDKDSGNAAYSTLPDYVKASLQYKNEDDLNAGLAQLNSTEIAKYLEKNGNVMDNELLTNNTDLSEMPSQEDYLNDSDALNNYLDRINAEKVKNATP
jgi:hypothetical protein